MSYKERPQDQPFVHGQEIVCNACAWGSVANAGAGMGKFSDEAYGVARHAIFVRPDSAIRRPEDLAGVEIGVALRAGSHFSVPLSLERHLPLDRIKTRNVGGHGTRLAVLLSGEVEASNLLDPEISMAEQLGLRKVLGGYVQHPVVGGRRHGCQGAGSLLSGAGWGRGGAAARAPGGICPCGSTVSHRASAIATGIFSRFNEGEHFVYERFPMDKYLELMDQMRRWGLDDVMDRKQYEQLVLAPA